MNRASIACWWVVCVCCVGLFTWSGCPAAPGSEVATEPGVSSDASVGQDKQAQEPTIESVSPDTFNKEENVAKENAPDGGAMDKEGQPDKAQPPEPTQEATPEPPAKATWAPAAPLPDKRQETAVAALNGEIYIVGGIDGNKSTVATVDAYNPKTDKWRNVADLPKKMHHANAIAYKGKLYVLGSLKPAFSADGDCFVYDPGTNKWSQLKAMPRSMERGASVLGVVGDKIYLIGGLRGFRSVTDMSEYDPKNDAWKALAPIPTDLDHLAGGAIGDKIVIAGGRHGNINDHIKSTYVYEPATDKWTKKSDMPTSRGGTAGAIYKGRLYIFGGEGDKSNNTGVFPQVESYELATDTWRKHIDMKTPRHGTNAAAIGNKIYVPGGATVRAFGAVATVEVFIPNH